MAGTAGKSWGTDGGNIAKSKRFDGILKGRIFGVGAFITDTVMVLCWISAATHEPIHISRKRAKPAIRFEADPHEPEHIRL